MPPERRRSPATCVGNLLKGGRTDVDMCGGGTRFGVLCLLAFVSGALSAASNVETPSGDPGLTTYVEQGFLPVTAFGAKPDDGQDDTIALQSAIEAALQRGLVAFFPSGRYLVSDTLKAMQPVEKNRRGRWLQDRRRANALVGATSGERPVLQLADHAPGFDDPRNPKPLVWFWAQPRNTERAGSTNPEHEQPNISFNQMFSGIDIDLRAAGNSGAVGIRHAGSQGCAIEGVKVRADGAFGGLYNMPGQGGGVYDLVVEGGRYGIWANHRSRYPVAAGVRLIGQTESAIHWNGQSNLTVAGFYIERSEPGPVVTSQAGRKAHNRALTLVDGIINGAGGRSLENAAGRSVYMRNLFVSGFGEIVRSGNLPAVSSHERSLVKEYSFAGAGTKSIVDGDPVRSEHEIRDVVAVDRLPDAKMFIGRHLWTGRPAPSFEDADAMSITRYGARPNDGVDDTDAIRAALEKHDKIFVPAGTFQVRQTLVLDRRTQLFGAAKHLSVIRADEDWDAPVGTPIVRTVDDPTAQTSLSFLMIERPAKRAELTLLDWRAGRKSVVRDVMGGQYGRAVDARAVKNSTTFRIAGSGGGRWYGLAAEWNRMSPTTIGSKSKNLQIEGTREPLAMYGLNIERGLSDPQAEIANAENVSIYYLKGESLGKHGGTASVLRVTGSKNISLFGYSGNARPKANAVLKIEKSSDVVLANVMPVRPGKDFDTVQIAGDSGVDSVDGRYPVALWRIGTPAVTY